MVALDAHLGVRADLRPLRDQEVIGDVVDRPWSGSIVRQRRDAGPKGRDGFDHLWVEEGLGYLIVGENLARDYAAGPGDLGSRIVDRNLLACGVDPVAE